MELKRMELIDAICVLHDGWTGPEEAVYDEALAIVKTRSKKIKSFRMAQLLREQADQIEGIERGPSELEKCPCCGSSASVGGGGSSSRGSMPYYVECNLRTCGMRTGTFYTRSHALAVWNNRK